MKPTKRYLSCTVTKHDGGKFNNPLKLSEAHFISQLAQENKSVHVELKEVHIDTYKSIFN